MEYNKLSPSEIEAFRSIMKRYRKYHEEVVSKSDMFDNIVKLSMSDCYNNLWLVLYDTDKHKYSTLEEVNKEIKQDKNN